MSEVTRTLARYLVGSRFTDIPQAVKHEAARALLNWAGCAIGSSHHETVECALAATSTEEARACDESKKAKGSGS